MSNRKDFYFRELVTEAELDSAFADLEDADHNLTGDLGFVGVVANGVVSQHAPVPDLTVDVSGPGAIYDQLGQRIFFSALQTVNLGADDNGVATVVSAAGKEKVVSLFAKFDRALSDLRIDGNSLTVFFRRDESFKFVVAQGGEANAGGAIPPPLRSDAILLADITRRFNQVQILAGDISTARRQDAFAIVGSPRTIRRGRMLEAISDVLSYYNAHASGVADRHPAAALDYAGGPNWMDGTANPATTVEGQLDKIVTDLAVGAGSTRIRAVASAGLPNALAAGSVQSQFDALLGFLNAHVNAAASAHPAAAIAYGGGPAWRDGTANGAAGVEAQLDKIVADLAADAGAMRVGSPARPAWLDGSSNPTGSVFEAMAKLVTDLIAQAAAGDGAGRVGARASGHLLAGTVRSQLDALDATSVRTNVPNAFTVPQTLNGADSDASPAMATTSPPHVRKLLWEIHGGSYSYRFYASLFALELVVNAKWTGSQWVKDLSGSPSSKLVLNNSELQVFANDGSASPFDDDWQFAVSFALNATSQTLDIGGNWVSTGPTETFAGAMGNGASNTLGASAPFRKVFPTTPSSFTFTLTSQGGLAGQPAAFTTSNVGLGVFVLVTPNTNSHFFCRVLAS